MYLASEYISKDSQKKIDIVSFKRKESKRHLSYPLRSANNDPRNKRPPLKQSFLDFDLGD
jgi:hypothetical protein